MATSGEQLTLPGAAPQPRTPPTQQPGSSIVPSDLPPRDQRQSLEAMVSRGPTSFPLIPLPMRRAGVTTEERLRTPHRFGSIEAPTLTSILHQLDKGQPEEWADLCEFALTTDDSLFSLYETRITRVTQAEYQVVPNQFGNPREAQLAADLVNEQLGRVRQWRRFLKHALHAEAIGFSCNEVLWGRDELTTQVYPERIRFVHPHRFRYDEQWVPRIYDRGSRRIQNKALAGGTYSRYGEALNPSGWIVHIGGGVSGYPSVAGYMRSVIWHWMFKRWIEKWLIGYAEGYGSGKAHGVVPKGATKEVRDKALAALENWANDGFAVLEEGSSIVFDATDLATSSDSIYKQALDYYERCMTKAVLGASDATDPGANGSQAAVGARTGATMDPRMVADGMALCDTLHDQLFYWICYFNRHLFSGGNVPPVPTMQFKTAADEQKVDAQGLQQQAQADAMMQGQRPQVQVPGQLMPQQPGALQSAQQQAVASNPQQAHPGEASDPAVQMADPMVQQAPQMAAAPAPQPLPMAAQPKSIDPKYAIDMAARVFEGKMDRAAACRQLQHFYGVDPVAAGEMIGPPPVHMAPAATPPAEQPQEPKATVEMSAAPEDMATLLAEIDALLGPQQQASA